MSEANREVNIDFVYKVLGCHERNFYELKTWMLNEDFRAELIRRKQAGDILSAAEVIQIMKDIYAQKDADRKAHPEFSFYTMRKAIKKLDKMHSSV